MSDAEVSGRPHGSAVIRFETVFGLPVRASTESAGYPTARDRTTFSTAQIGHPDREHEHRRKRLSTSTIGSEWADERNGRDHAVATGDCPLSAAWSIRGGFRVTQDYPVWRKIGSSDPGVRQFQAAGFRRDGSSVQWAFGKESPTNAGPSGTGSTMGAMSTEISLVKWHLCRA